MGHRRRPYDRTVEFSKGFREGLKAALPGCIQLSYAAAILAEKKEFNMSDDDCERFLIRFADILTNEIDSEEAANKVFEEMGIRIVQEDDPFNFIEHCEV